MSDNTGPDLQHPILAKIDELEKGMAVVREGMFMAARFCPDTEVARVLNNICESFIVFDSSLFEIRLRLEALLDERNEQSFQNVEGPDQ